MTSTKPQSELIFLDQIAPFQSKIFINFNRNKNSRCFGNYFALHLHISIVQYVVMYTFLSVCILYCIYIQRKLISQYTGILDVFEYIVMSLLQGFAIRKLLLKSHNSYNFSQPIRNNLMTISHAFM